MGKSIPQEETTRIAMVLDKMEKLYELKQIVQSHMDKEEQVVAQMQADLTSLKTGMTAITEAVSNLVANQKAAATESELKLQSCKTTLSSDMNKQFRDYIKSNMDSVESKLNEIRTELKEGRKLSEERAKSVHIRIDAEEHKRAAVENDVAALKVMVEDNAYFKKQMQSMMYKALLSGTTGGAAVAALIAKMGGA